MFFLKFFQHMPIDFHGECFFFCPACVSSKALGMESGKIPNQAINASSFLNNNHKPSYGRLNINKHHCSWTPKLKEKNAWLQVDFGQLTTVTGIATQGKCNENHWMTSCWISYSNDGKNWVYFQQARKNRVKSS